MMPAVLAFDLGKHLGYGIVGRGRPVSGSWEITKRWAGALGPGLLALEDRMHSIIVELKPTHLAAATQFFRIDQADTASLIPLYSTFGVLHMLGAAVGLPVILVVEHDARCAFLGNGMVPGRKAQLKDAALKACMQRNWPVTDDHAADALCVASFALSTLAPASAHETTPLFQAAPTMRLRRSRRAS